MTPSIVGINFSLDHTADVEKRDTFHTALAPAFSVAMVDSAKDVSKIKDVQETYKDTIIIGRIWHKLQGGFHLKPEAKEDAGKEFVASPEDVADEMGDLGISGKSWAYVLNEPKGNGDADNLDRLFKWNVRWMDRSIMQKRRSVMFNWGDREPAIENGAWNDRWQALLKRMAAYPNLFMIGMHFYGPDDLVLHLEAYVKTCELLKITPLKVIATEFGVDTDAGSATNGYRSRGWDGDKFGQWIEQSVTTDLAPYIKGNVLAGLCLFTWSKNPEWSAFDITDDVGLQNYLLDAKKRGVLNPPAPNTTTLTVPVVKLFPSDFEIRAIERWVKGKTASQYIRKYPYITSERIDLVATDGMRCDIIPAHALHPDEVIPETINNVQGVWIPVKCNAARGWLWDGAITTEIIPEKTITNEVPKTEPIMPSEPVVMPQFPPMMPPVATAELPLATLQLMRKALQDQITVLDFYIGTLIKAN